MDARIGSLILDLEDEWGYVTDDVAPGPFTLSRQASDACGAFQFSTAVYRGGTVPDPTPEDLAALLNEGLGVSTDNVLESSPLRLAAATFRDEEWVIRVWYVSDGRNIAKMTYTALKSNAFESELAQCEKMVRSVRFLEDPARR
jgi:hypothetical protein